RPLQEIAQDKHWDVDDLEEALLAVQEFDPLGVGARDLRECLLIQIRAMSGDHLLLKKFVEDHLHDIEKRQFKKIAQSLKIPLEQVGELLEQLRHLEPKPGRPFSGRDAQHVVPDIYIVKVGDEYNVVLNDDGMPRLRVSNFYKSMITNGAVGKDKEYIQERLRSAVWMIRSIHQRQRTIYKVTQSIVKHQRPFLEKGVTALRPMVLRDVAEDIEMHESTISRATTNKYVHTPQGIYELKFFFNSGIDSTDGSEALASEAVKQHIASIIDEEDSKKPYSDQAIVKLLAAKHGLKIARRTVTKYREILGYPSSTKRKKVF
ncbi:RNA polymerase factor sigma-54, partial [bacterium]|nr:RNA polymerase factor sigma-54 [bacterium]